MADTTTPATTPATDVVEGDLYSCDHCDFQSEWEDDFWNLGGYDHPVYGAVPATCNACQEAEHKAAERLYARLRFQ
jgi:hypothetical protein